MENKIQINLKNDTLITIPSSNISEKPEKSKLSYSKKSNIKILPFQRGRKDKVKKTIKE